MADSFILPGAQGGERIEDIERLRPDKALSYQPSWRLGPGYGSPFGKLMASPIDRWCGATPVIVLNKVNLCPDVDVCIRNVEAIATVMSIHPVSAKEQVGLDTLRNYLTKGNTVAFLGSSGVGKSALINTLLGIERRILGKSERMTAWVDILRPNVSLFFFLLVA
jgi:ABC-type multidrug transport system fused ATPase/permease subunit